MTKRSGVSPRESRSAFEKRDKKLGCGCILCRNQRKIGRLDALRWTLRKIDKGVTGEQCGYVLNDAIDKILAEIKKGKAK